MTSAERERYSRQIRFHGIGEQGQERLLDSTAAVIGCGALGSFAAAALARAGVGTLILVDRDYVEWSNLQRQWLYEESDAAEGLPKAVAAARRIGRINSHITARAEICDLTPGNIDDVFEDADFILDGTDNFETRYLVNDWAVLKGVPWVYGGAVSSYGISMPVLPGKTSCLKCVYPEPPAGVQPTCETAGVVNAVTSLVASIEAATALQALVGAEPARKITTVDMWPVSIRQITQPPPSPDCPCCGQRQFVHLRGPRRVPISLCGRNAVQIHERARPVDLAALAAQLAPLGEVRRNEFALRFFLPPHEITVFPDGRAIIKGTTDVGVARSLYARYIGA